MWLKTLNNCDIKSTKHVFVWLSTRLSTKHTFDILNIGITLV